MGRLVTLLKIDIKNSMLIPFVLMGLVSIQGFNHFAIPVKPAGPERVFFVLAMLVLATIITSTYLVMKSKVLES